MDRRERTQRLDVVLIKTPLHVFDHEASLPDLRVPNHSHLDDDAGTRVSVVPLWRVEMDKPILLVSILQWLMVLTTGTGDC